MRNSAISFAALIVGALAIYAFVASKIESEIGGESLGIGSMLRSGNISTMLFTGLLAFVYFAPSFVAALRKHPTQNSIAVVNIFLGWTLLGWVVALAWAVGPVSEDKK